MQARRLGWQLPAFVLTFLGSVFLRAAATNDNFQDAIVFKGYAAGSPELDISDATTEPGEPAHLGPGVACKTLWWRWQAPRNALTGFTERYDSSASNVLFAVYTGPSVEALSLVYRNPVTGFASFNAVGGTTYYIAAVVPESTDGSFVCSLYEDTVTYAPSVPVPGNLLKEPSFENTGLEFTYWKTDNPVGGFVNDRGGADGTTWPDLNGQTLWQDFPTVPGRNYEIRFAFATDNGQLRVLWDQREIGIAELPAGDGNWWHWAAMTATASNTTSRLSLQSMNGEIFLDAVSVAWMNEPPKIVTEPTSASTITGGSVSFLVGATGTLPLHYQWYFGNAPLRGQTDKSLLLDSVTTEQAGEYLVVVTNAFGAVTSAPVNLVVDAPEAPTILLQPYSDQVVVGGYFSLSAAAIGTAPLQYQWFTNDTAVPGATNRELVFTNFQASDAGTYKLKVWNPAGTVWSLPATLVAWEASGGGTVLLANEFVNGPLTNKAPVFDVDGTTLLSNPDCVAQLYAGQSIALLRAVGAPTPFKSGYYAGFFGPEVVTLPTVPAGSNAFVQVRAWDSSKATSYEEARALGAKFGRSDLFQLTAASDSFQPAPLVGLESFSLHAGLPEFSAGRLDVLGEQDGKVLWSLHGNAGYLYLIERSGSDFVWRPLIVLTNATGTVTFTDPDPPADDQGFYRARILE